MKMFLNCIPSSHFLSPNSNQEELERVKKDIEDQKSRKLSLDTERERTNVVLESIKNALVSMLMKLQDMDEFTADLQAKRRIAKNLNFPAHSAVNEATSTDQIVQMLQEKVKVGLIATGQIGDGEGIDSGLSEEEDEPEEVERKESVAGGRKMKKTQDFSYSSTSQAASSETAAAAGLFDDEEKKSETSFAIDEKPPPYPQVYSSLITGRSTGLVSASPGAGGGKQCCLLIIFSFILASISLLFCYSSGQTKALRLSWETFGFFIF